MFCQKCGKELIEGAVFCSSCGNPVQIQGEVTNAASTVPQNNIANKTTAIKRSKPWYKRWWIWVIAAAVVISFILSAISSESVDYIESVKQVAPYENSGMSATYGTILDKYISECNWQERPLSRKSAYIDVNGKVIDKDGSESYVVITFKVEPYEGKPSGMFTVSPDALVLDRVNYNAAAASGFISKLFDAYDKGFDTYAEYLATDGTQPTDERNQTEQAAVSDTPVYDVDELGYLLGTRSVYLYDEYGILSGKYDQCESIKIDDKYGVRYGDLTILSAESGDIMQISTTNPNTFQKNGISLDKNEKELIALLGEPAVGGQDQGLYCLAFLCDGYSLSVKFNDPTEAPCEIIVHF